MARKRSPSASPAPSSHLEDEHQHSPDRHHHPPSSSSKRRRSNSPESCSSKKLAYGGGHQGQIDGTSSRTRQRRRSRSPTLRERDRRDRDRQRERERDRGRERERDRGRDRDREKERERERERDRGRNRERDRDRERERERDRERRELDPRHSRSRDTFRPPRRHSRRSRSPSPSPTPSRSRSTSRSRSSSRSTEGSPSDEETGSSYSRSSRSRSRSRSPVKEERRRVNGERRYKCDDSVKNNSESGDVGEDNQHEWVGRHHDQGEPHHSDEDVRMKQEDGDIADDNEDQGHGDQRRDGPHVYGQVAGNRACRVYVGNLPYSFRWWELKDLAREVGDVVHVQIMTGPDSRSKGCGIIEYRTPDDARNAISSLHDRSVQGRPIFVREDREEGVGERRMAAQVFVQNLPYSVRWQELKDRFRGAGKVLKADVLVFHDTGRSKGLGTVLFEDAEDAKAAIDKFNGTDWNGRTIEVREDRMTKPRSRFGGAPFGAAPGMPFRGRGGGGWGYRGRGGPPPPFGGHGPPPHPPPAHHNHHQGGHPGGPVS